SRTRRHVRANDIGEDRGLLREAVRRQHRRAGSRLRPVQPSPTHRRVLPRRLCVRPGRGIPNSRARPQRQDRSRLPRERCTSGGAVPVLPGFGAQDPRLAPVPGLRAVTKGEPSMRVFVTAIVAITTAAVVAGAAADRALAASLCVGSHGGCYQTIQSAVDAAHDGDKITIRPGMYAGGITIDKSVSLEGAGASSTMISGGGPVITIGVAGAPSEPAVGITGVTVTGGVNTGTQALGGGVYVPASSAGSGATVTITDSVVTGNHAAPASAAIGCGG